MLRQVGLDDLIEQKTSASDAESSKPDPDMVALLCGGWSADALRGAIAIYEDPADLDAHFTSSPFSYAARNPVKSNTI
jgi:phosphoglycolate phosphatase-like HAD superfamily hydrolase